MKKKKDTKNRRKRAKTTKAHVLYYKAARVEYSCPHCKTEIVDYTIRESIVRILCSHCKEEIILDWEEKIE